MSICIGKACQIAGTVTLDGLSSSEALTYCTNKKMLANCPETNQVLPQADRNDKQIERFCIAGDNAAARIWQNEDMHTSIRKPHQFSCEHPLHTRGRNIKAADAAQCESFT